MLITIAVAVSLAAQATAAPAPAEPRPWTLLVYGAADNNADGPILEFLDGVRKALDDDPGMELVLFLDRSEGYSDDASLLGEDFHGARIYRLRKDSAELLDADEFFPGMSADADYEVDSADPQNVAAFVRFGKAHFPAERTGLMIYSHADGCTMCPDEESGRSMSIPELTDWVEEDCSVDFLALELCNMGGLEIAYQWRPGNGGFSADVLVAIPNAGPPLDWDRAFRRIRSEGHVRAIDASGGASQEELLDPATMTPAAFGRLVIEEGERGRRAMAEAYPDDAERVAYEAAGCYDLRLAEAAKEAVDALAVSLWKAGAKDLFEELRDGAADGEPVMNYVRGSFRARPYVDAYALAQRAAACERLPQDARAASRATMQALDALVLASFGMDALHGFERGKHGIFLAFPDGDGPPGGPGASRAWQELAWYSPLEAGGEGAPYGRWAFLADGATPGNGEVENWFELLDAWFDDTSKGAKGSNRYAW